MRSKIAEKTLTPKRPFRPRTKILDALSGLCINEPVLELEYATLERATDESAYRSICPICLHGVLLVRRNDDMRLSNHDNCILCGQRVHYTGLKGQSPVEEPID